MIEKKEDSNTTVVLQGGYCESILILYVIVPYLNQSPLQIQQTTHNCRKR